MDEKEFLDMLKLSSDEIKKLEENTRGQNKNELWKKERNKRLTASDFGKICKLRESTSKENTAINLLNDLSNLPTMIMALENEEKATRDFEQKCGKKISPCGLFVDENYSYFGASPDGYIESEDALVEIHCPSSAAEFTPDEAIDKKIIKCVEKKNGEFKLKENHNIYYQIQGQLNICSKEKCYFIIWTPKGIIYEVISRDEEFWESILQKLEDFYKNHLLKEILRRQNR